MRKQKKEKLWNVLEFALSLKNSKFASDKNLFKMKYNKYFNIPIYSLSLLLTACIFSLSSCNAPGKVAYFQDINKEIIQLQEPAQIKIEPNDKLTITVKTMDPALSSLFNLQVVSDRLGENESFSSSSGNLKPSSTGISKYTVSPEGYIDFPLLGSLKVAGMTRNELSGFIKGELMGRELAKDPVVTVEFINMGVSILGEVLNPGRYDINRDQINILEGLSMAGDLTINGQRENVAIIRETPEGIQTYRLDLTNFKELAASPAYYLKQGDIIYVEPNEQRKRQTTTNGNNILSTGFWVSVASLATSIVTTVAVFVR